jgi:repressor LexA
MEHLTPTQEKVFRYICEFATREGFPPAYAEIAHEFGFSSDGTVRTYLEHLEKKGFIQRLGKARGIKILKPIVPKGIAIIGKVAAGNMRPAYEEHAGNIEEIPELKYQEGRFALKVVGDSMKDAGIMDGDLAIIQAGIPVYNGQIAAVIYQGDATLKRIYFEKDTVRLQPENEFYQAVSIKRSEFDSMVCGRYIALVRKI